MPGFNLTNHYTLPDLKGGFELAPKKSWFGVIIPEASENLVTNPSFELATTGYTAVNSSFVQSTEKVKWGFYSLKVTPQTGVNSGVYFGTITTYTNLWYTLSADIYSTRPGEWYRVYFADTSGNQVGNYARFKATGFWQRVWINYLETANTTRRLYIIRESIASTSPFYVDGVQCEQKDHPTTYLDGDLSGYLVGQTAYYWTGAAHASTSIRIADTGSGGREMNLLDLGFRIMAIVGLGMMPFNLVATPIAIGGAYYQRSIPTTRQFSLAGAITADNHTQLQRIREELINAFTPYRTATHQPLLLKYHKLDESETEMDVLNIPAVYQSGLETQDSNPYQEKIALTFQQFLPFLQSDSSVIGEGMIQSIDSTWVLSLDNEAGTKTPQGGDLGVAAPNLSKEFYFGLTKKYAGGTFTYTNPGTAVTGNGIIQNAGSGWVLVGQGIVSGGTPSVFGIVEDNSGNLYIGGSFSSVLNTGGGSVATNCIAKWDGAAWSTLGGVGTGSTAQAVYALAKHPSTGNIYVAGNFTTINGTGRAGIAMWNGSTWSSLGTGIAGGSAVIYSLVFDASGNLYAGGSFTTAGGVTVNNIAKWDGANWTAMGGTPGTNGAVQDVEIDTFGNVYVVGSFTTAGGSAANYFAKWNGSSWSSSSSLNAEATELSIDNVNYRMFVGGTFLYDTTNKAYSGIAVIDLATNRWYPFSGKYGVSGMKYEETSKTLWVGGAYTYFGIDYPVSGGYPIGELGIYKKSIQKWESMGYVQYNGNRVYCYAQNPITGEIYLGGNFTQINGVSASYLAKWNGQTFSSVTTITGSVVTAMTFDTSGNLYISGTFTNVGGVAATNIAKYTLSTNVWSAMGTGLSGSARKLFYSTRNGFLYAGGGFVTAGGVTVNGVGVWNGSSWSGLGSPAGVSGGTSTVNDLSMDSNFNLYIGGNFTSAGGVTAYRVARWNGSGWLPMAGLADGTAGLSVENLSIDPSNNYVWVSGNTLIGSVRTGIAYWNGNVWTVLSNIDNSELLSYGMASRNGEMYFFQSPGNGTYTIFKKDAGSNVLKFAFSVYIRHPNIPSTIDSFPVLLDLNGNLYYNSLYYSSATPVEPKLWTGIFSEADAQYFEISISGPCDIYRLINYSTGESISFSNLTLLDGQIAILTKNQYGISFERNDGTNLIGYIDGPTSMSIKNGYNKIVLLANLVGYNANVLVRMTKQYVGIK